MKIPELLRLPGMTKRRAMELALLFFAFIITAQIGLELYTSPALITPVAGVALAGLVLGGLSLWPAIFLGAAVVYLINGFSWLSILVLPTAYTLQALAGAYALKRLNFDPLLTRMRDMFALMGIALTTSVIVPTFGYASAYVNVHFFSGSFPMISWGAWWVGMITSIIIVAPLTIRWLAEPRHLHYSGRRLAEILIVFISFTAINIVFWWIEKASIIDLYLFYAILVLLMWMALRLGSRITASGLFAFTFLALSGAIYGFKETTEPLGDQLFGIEILILTIAFIIFIIVSIGEERTTALNKLEEQVDKLGVALRKMSEQDQAKSNFIAVLAHELRNPLAPIVTSIELLKLKGPARPEDAQIYDLIEGRTNTIRRLLDDLLDVSRISRDKLTLHRENIDLSEIVRRSVHSIDTQFSAREQTLSASLPENPLYIDADPVRVEQSISNLLSNASKFTEPKGRISVTAARVGDSAELRIKDNGIGIEPAMLERIFEPFLQAERGGEGLGIGLSLTRQLVELQDGTVEARSEGQGKGSEFIVRFPLASSADAIETTPEKSEEATAPNEYRVLVVDDNQEAAWSIASLLKLKGGFVTECAYTGTEAKSKYGAFRPDAIVLDIGLPDTDGYEVAKMLRGERGFVGPIIALTGYGQEEDKRKAFAAGFDHHFTKPVGIDDLMAVCGSR